VDVEFQEQLSAWNQQIAQRVTEAQRLREAVGQLSASAESAGGEVRVTVDGAGDLRGLELSSRAIRALSGPELSDLILSTLRSAQRRLAADVRAAASPILGDDSRSLRAVSAGLQARYGSDEWEE
jgi:DNA-binding protein YbaB